MSPEEFVLTRESLLTREKKEMRRGLVARRDALPKDERKRHSRIAGEHALSLIRKIRTGREGTFTIALFLSFGSEIDTRPVFSGLFEEQSPDLVLLLPSLRQSKEIVLRPWRKDDPLTPGPFGILEPETRDAASPVEVDLFILPGVGFDRAGHRLGYGRGYYDRLLARAGLQGIRAGLAFSEQVVPKIPAGPGDIPVHYLVTEKGWFACG